MLCLHRRRFLRGLFDRADVQEGLLGQVIPLALDEFLNPDRIFLDDGAADLKVRLLMPAAMPS